MRRTQILLFIAAVVLGLTSCSRQLTEEVRAQQYVNAQIAYQSVKSGQFVLETDRIMFKRGFTLNVSPSTNYFALDNGHAILQISTNAPSPGFNGLGGITLEGRTQNMKESVDKNGTLRQDFMVSGSGMNARVYVTLPKGSDRATVDVEGTFYPTRISMYGQISPYDGDLLIKGRTTP